MVHEIINVHKHAIGIHPPEYDKEFTSHKGKWKLLSVKDKVGTYELIEPSARFFEIKGEKELEEIEIMIQKRMDKIVRKQAINELKAENKLGQEYPEI